MTETLFHGIGPWLHIASAAFVFPTFPPKRLGNPYEIYFPFGQLRVRRERPSHDLTNLNFEFDEIIEGELKQSFVFDCLIRRGLHPEGKAYLFINMGDTRTKFILHPHSEEQSVKYFNDTNSEDVEHFVTLMTLSTPSVLGLFNAAR